MVLHSYYGFVVPFQVNFAILKVTLLLVMIYHQARMGNKTSRIFLELYAGFLLLAGCCFMIDRDYCEEVSKLSINPQLHSWWHVSISLTSHYSLMFLMVLARTTTKRTFCAIEGWPIRKPKFLPV